MKTGDNDEISVLSFTNILTIPHGPHHKRHATKAMWKEADNPEDFLTELEEELDRLSLGDKQASEPAEKHLRDRHRLESEPEALQ